jgi:hypothetical protein
MTRGINTLATWVDSLKFQGDLDFVFDERESEVKLHKTSSTESPSNVSTGTADQIIGNQTGYGTIDQILSQEKPDGLAHIKSTHQSILSTLMK